MGFEQNSLKLDKPLETHSSPKKIFTQTMHGYILIKIYIRHASKSIVQKTILVPSDETIFNEKQFHKQTKLSLHFPSTVTPRKTEKFMNETKVLPCNPNSSHGLKYTRACGSLISREL